jgi:hypothetical protein
LLANEELELPYRILRQLETSSAQELYEIRNRRDQVLLQHLCLQVDCDREWESLPNDVRIMLVNRVCGETYKINETQTQWLESRTRIPVNAYISRRDLHCYITLMIDDYTATLLRHPVQQTLSSRWEVSHDLVAEVQKEVASTPHRSILRPFIALVRSLRTFVKFGVLAMIAEPEFQRELAYLLKRSWFRRPIMFMSTRIWICARMIQNLLVPWFIVCRFLSR